MYIHSTNNKQLKFNNLNAHISARKRFNLKFIYRNRNWRDHTEHDQSTIIPQGNV